eukprot:GHVN01106669.1.p1 GENE.GHVN01106669.1~~GHVN01106669.1.p1  ORF type:complete len:427 (+),score=33.32 GHVN01106669.1:1012-2292(+)
MVVSLQQLKKEIDYAMKVVPDAIERLFISDRAHLVLNIHKQIDSLSEMRRGTDSPASTESGKSASQIAPIGTTGRGIGPTYATKASRTGLRLGDLKRDWSEFVEKYTFMISVLTAQYGITDYDSKSELIELSDCLKVFGHRIVDTVSFVGDMVEDGRRVLIEGANAALLDLDFGTYPFVTSSSASSGGMCTGLGLPPRAIQHIVGVAKAYTSRVGAGPFPTELDAKTGPGEHLQRVGREYGTTTGRPRRVGWLDCQSLRYALRVDGAAELFLTKLDTLTGLHPIKICTGYRDKVMGTPIRPREFPSNEARLNELEPIYEEMPGWKHDLTKLTKFTEFPVEAQKYVQRIEELLDARISWVGVGPAPENTVEITPTIREKFFNATRPRTAKSCQCGAVCQCGPLCQCRSTGECCKSLLGSEWYDRSTE